MTLYNEAGHAIEEDYEALLADVYPYLGWSTDPVRTVDFNGADETWGVVHALDMAWRLGHRVPDHVLAPIVEEFTAFTHSDQSAFKQVGDMALMYIDRIRALDNA